MLADISIIQSFPDKTARNWTLERLFFYSYSFISFGISITILSGIFPVFQPTFSPFLSSRAFF